MAWTNVDTFRVDMSANAECWPRVLFAADCCQLFLTRLSVTPGDLEGEKDTTVHSTYDGRGGGLRHPASVLLPNRRWTMAHGHPSTETVSSAPF